MKFAEWVLKEDAMDNIFQAIMDEPGNRMNYMALSDAMQDGDDPHGFGPMLARVAQGASASSLDNKNYQVHAVKPFAHVMRHITRAEKEHWVVRVTDHPPQIRRMRSQWVFREGVGMTYFYKDDEASQVLMTPRPLANASQFVNKAMIWENGSVCNFLNVGVDVRILLLAGMAELAT